MVVKHRRMKPRVKTRRVSSILVAGILLSVAANVYFFRYLPSAADDNSAIKSLDSPLIRSTDCDRTNRSQDKRPTEIDGPRYANTPQETRKEEGRPSVPPIYWINLPQSTDRRQLFEEHLASLSSSSLSSEGRDGPSFNIQHRRISAFNASQAKQMVDDGAFEMNQIELIPLDDMEKKPSGADARHNYKEVACTISHLHAIKQAYDDGHEHVLFMEDDMEITKHFIQNWEKAVDAAPENWKSLQWISVSIPFRERAFQSSDSWTSWQPRWFSTGAYSLNRKGMASLLEKVLRVGYPQHAAALDDARQQEHDRIWSSTNGISGLGKSSVDGNHPVKMVWKIPERGMLLADEAIYYLAGDTYTATDIFWFNRFALDSTIERNKRNPAYPPPPPGYLHSQQARRFSRRSEKVLVFMAFYASTPSRLRQEMERLREDAKFLSRLHQHGHTRWRVSAVLHDDENLRSILEEEQNHLNDDQMMHDGTIDIDIDIMSSTMPPVHDKVPNMAARLRNKYKYEIVKLSLGLMKDFDVIVVKDNNARVAGFEWNTLMNSRNDSLVIAPLSQSTSTTTKRFWNGMHSLEQSGNCTMFDAAHWGLLLLHHPQFSNVETTLRIPYLPSKFVVIDAAYAFWYFSIILGSYDDGIRDYQSVRMASDIGPLSMICDAANDYDRSRRSCSLSMLIVKLDVSSNDDIFDSFPPHGVLEQYDDLDIDDVVVPIMLPGTSRNQTIGHVSHDSMNNNHGNKYNDDDGGAVVLNEWMKGAVWARDNIRDISLPDLKQDCIAKSTLPSGFDLQACIDLMQYPDYLHIDDEEYVAVDTGSGSGQKSPPNDARWRSEPKILWGIPTTKAASAQRQNLRDTYLGYFKASTHGKTHGNGEDRTSSRTRICSLHDIMSNKVTTAACQIAYTFVVGGNDDGPASLLGKQSIDDMILLASSRQHEQELAPSNANETDILYLNISDSDSINKTLTWFNLGSMLANVHGFELVAKVDPDVLVFVPSLLEYVASHPLIIGRKGRRDRKKRDTGRHTKKKLNATFGGLVVYGTDCDSDDSDDEDECPLQLEGRNMWMSGEFNFMTPDLAEFIASDDCDRKQLAIAGNEDASVSNFVFSYDSVTRTHSNRNAVQTVSIPAGRIVRTMKIDAGKATVVSAAEFAREFDIQALWAKRSGVLGEYFGDDTATSQQMWQAYLAKGPKMTLQDFSLDRFIIVPEYKLLFCYMEKVGGSMFSHLFRMLRIIHPDISEAEADFQSRYLWFRNGPNHHKKSRTDLENIFEDSEWTKAVFYRDPIKRFVSAYRSKCEGADTDGTRICKEVFGKPNATFEDAVHTPMDILATDPHFSRQVDFCGGSLHQVYSNYNFVRELATETTPHTVADLLDVIGVEKRLAGELIESVVRYGGTNIKYDLELIHNRTEWKDFEFTGLVAQEGHNTGTSQHVTDDYLADEELKSILRYNYAWDYRVFFDAASK